MLYTTASGPPKRRAGGAEANGARDGQVESARPSCAGPSKARRETRSEAQHAESRRQKAGGYSLGWRKHLQIVSSSDVLQHPVPLPFLCSPRAPFASVSSPALAIIAITAIVAIIAKVITYVAAISACDRSEQWERAGREIPKRPFPIPPPSCLGPRATVCIVSPIKYMLVRCYCFACQIRLRIVSFMLLYSISDFIPQTIICELMFVGFRIVLTAGPEGVTGGRYVCVYVCIYIYIEREREIDRSRGSAGAPRPSPSRPTKTLST